ncbi:MAG: response regulator transcription factor [Nakamurella sp.]
MQTAQAAPALRIVIGEDDVLLREGLAQILEAAGLDVVARAGDADELLRKIIAFRPDIAIVDVRMPPRREDDGLVVAIEVRRRLPGTGVLVLSQFCEPSFVTDLIDGRPAGVGYLLKERVGDVSAFVDAIRRVAAGGSVLDPEVIALMLGGRAMAGASQLLTPREREVLAAMAEGHSNLGISRTLLMSQASVEKYVTALFRKLNLSATDTDHRRVLAVLTYLQGRTHR